jgi:hypothetical protein
VTATPKRSLEPDLFGTSLDAGAKDEIYAELPLANKDGSVDY